MPDLPLEPAGARRATVLVVDDTPNNLSLMSSLLEEIYTVKLAPNGSRALVIAANSPPDLILLDIMMPEMDGYEVCSRLKANLLTRDVPVIFLTAMDAMEDEEKGLLAGAVDYITKPISPPILLARVHNQLALKLAADELREQYHLVEQEKIRARDLLQKLKKAADGLLEQNRQLKHEKQRADELLHMLVATYLNHGQLDLAWGILRQSRLNEPVMEDLYALALRFESARQFDMAESAFRLMAEFNPAFRDLESRLNQVQTEIRLAKASSAENAQVNSKAAAMTSGTLEQSSLGRYEVEKVLGKGAMGVVYLGKDPKIGRKVAIKTMPLKQEGGDPLNVIKERFYREAESAGRLTHPNIVAIYDVGEQDDLAYIAMEFLGGTDLTPFAKPGSLLALDKVLSIVARVAEALAYAHEHNVVHRDIKPANIVYEPESDDVKVTDFGIASIINTTNADSGRVLGTPSYMSPEQIAGQTIDGRADLYSLGVMLYQLVSGRLPFEAESLDKLLLNIANDPPTDIRTHNAELPDCVASLLDKALAKDPEKRYQDGERMAKALSVCRRSLMVFAK